MHGGRVHCSAPTQAGAVACIGSGPKAGHGTIHGNLQSTEPVLLSLAAQTIEPFEVCGLLLPGGMGRRGAHDRRQRDANAAEETVRLSCLSENNLSSLEGNAAGAGAQQHPAQRIYRREDRVCERLHQTVPSVTAQAGEGRIAVEGRRKGPPAEPS